MKRDKIKKK